MSKAYSLKAIQKVPVSLDDAWAFFSDPKNLSNITPGNMGFSFVAKQLKQIFSFRYNKVEELFGRIN